MSRMLLAAALLIGLPVGAAAQAAPAAAPAGALPPAAPLQVDYLRDIEPILARSCARCHARGQEKGGFSLMTRDAILAGGDSGAAVIPGNSGASLLIELVAGVDPDEVMPQKGSRLTPVQVGLLRAWIDQGVAFAPSPAFTRAAPRNLDPRRPPLPDGSAPDAHPVDLLLAPYLARHGVSLPPLADDRTFARRVSLDLVGLLPSPARVEAFEADRTPGKRARLAQALLADRQEYATHWLAFWNDLLRNDYRGPGYIDGGRRQISAWLFAALRDNLPYDRFVAALVNPSPASAGFTKGIVWRGVVNASQTPPMQAAQNVSQVFMGVNLKCASCHDSFINDWQLADAYGLAGVYADGPLEMVECDRPTGKQAPMKFLYPGLATIDAQAGRQERLQQLAHAITSPRNGRLSRTIVNRLWARLMGRGLVEPLDDMDRPAWDPDLLDWLAEDLVAHGFDLKHTLARIVTSRAYQSRMAGDPDPNVPYVFGGPTVRRLSAEQFADALSTITNDWPLVPAGEFDDAIADGAAPPLTARFVWSPARAAAASSSTRYFRRSFTLASRPAHAPLVVSFPRRVTIHVNGVAAFESGETSRPQVVDVAPHLESGRNVIAVAVTPARQPASDPRAKPPPQGLLLQLHGRTRTGPLATIVATDARWRWSATAAEGWELPSFDARAWRLVDVPEAWLVKPPRHATHLPTSLALSTLHGRARAAFAPADPLTTALGRPNREQVVTERTTAPTTLQLLELSNGPTLAARLRRGAERLLADGQGTPSQLVDRIYRRALSRAPTDREAALALQLLGPAADAAAVEDLLWAVAMLPEFQLIH